MVTAVAFGSKVEDNVDVDVVVGGEGDGIGGGGEGEEGDGNTLVDVVKELCNPRAVDDDTAAVEPPPPPPPPPPPLVAVDETCGFFSLLSGFDVRTLHVMRTRREFVVDESERVSV
jgi:hypothetical protein